MCVMILSRQCGGRHHQKANRVIEESANKSQKEMRRAQEAKHKSAALRSQVEANWGEVRSKQRERRAADRRLGQREHACIAHVHG